MKYSYFRLDELGIVSRGRSKHRPRNDSSLYGGEYPFIQTADVKNAGLYITEWNQTYNEKGLAQSKLWKPGTLCITIAANIADTAILCMPACFPDSIIGFIPFEDKCDVKYMKYCFDILQMECQQIAEGTAQDNLSWEKLSTIRFPMPDIAIQNRIASILSAYDDLIENNRRQIKLLEEAAQQLYREWFVELRFPGHENVKIVDGVPEGWSVNKIQDILTVCYGKDHKKVADGDIPVYGSGGYMRACQRPLFTGQSVLIPRKGSLNNIMYVDESFWTVDTMFYTVMKLPHIAHYVFQFMKTLDFYNMNTGAAVPSTTSETLNNLMIMVPKESILKQFDGIVQDLVSMKTCLEKQIRILTDIRDLLLPKLMSGEMEV